LWESFQDHWGHVPEPLDNFKDRFKTYLENDPDTDPKSLCLLAVAGGEPVGGDICKREAFGEPGLGWINLLGVRRGWRKHGIGKALLQHSFYLLQSIGMRQVGLDVDSENITGALRLYESVGLRTVRRAVTFLNELRPGNDLTVQDYHDGAIQD
jgi:mycothiol synthase